MSKLPKDPSGIIVHDQTLFIVGNRSNRQFFCFDAAPLQHSTSIRLKDLKLIDRVRLSHQAAEDLESIEVLEEQIVVLSENSRRIFTDDRTTVDYSDLSDFQESDGRGLEGMAIRANADGSSNVAVVWEGSDRSHKELSEAPRLLVHQVGKGSVGTRMKLRHHYWDSLTRPILIDENLQKQPFRVPDLVWCRLSNSESTDDPQSKSRPSEVGSQNRDSNLLVLLSHHHDSNQKFLQVIDDAGNSIGQPVGLVELGMPESLLTLNWEGLCWFADQNGEESLLLVNDTDKKSEKYVCKIQPPSGIRPSLVC